MLDPVLVATSGHSLAAAAAVPAMRDHLLPLATVVTPNLPEASALLGGRPVDTIEDMQQVGCACKSIRAAAHTHTRTHTHSHTLELCKGMQQPGCDLRTGARMLAGPVTA